MMENKIYRVRIYNHTNGRVWTEAGYDMDFLWFTKEDIFTHWQSCKQHYSQITQQTGVRYTLSLQMLTDKGQGRTIAKEKTYKIDFDNDNKEIV